MSELHEEQEIYYIPDNFVEEGRIFQGKIRIRYLIEGIVLSLGFAVAGIAVILSVPGMALENKVLILVTLCGPTMAIGLTGFNGDPISVVIKCALAWAKKRTTMLYNPKPRLLKRDPLLTIINRKRSVDGFMEAIETKQQEAISKKVNLSLKEGEDFVFEKDEHIDSYTKRHSKQPVRKILTEEREYTINKENPADRAATIVKMARKGEIQITDTEIADDFDDVLFEINTAKPVFQKNDSAVFASTYVDEDEEVLF